MIFKKKIFIKFEIMTLEFGALRMLARARTFQMKSPGKPLAE